MLARLCKIKNNDYYSILLPDGTIKKAMEHIYAKVDVGNITQTGEGQRGVTNSKIKKMFLQNRYFVYNGDKLRAEAITAMRNDEKNGFDYGPLVKSDGTPYTLEELEEKNILFCDTDTALKKYPELFEKYFN